MGHSCRVDKTYRDLPWAILLGHDEALESFEFILEK